MGLREGLGKLFPRREEEEDDYLDLDLDIEEYEEGLDEQEEVKMYVKTADLTGLFDIPALKKEIYAGNLLIVDISLAKHDKVLIEKAIKDLKLATLDVGGDIAGIGEDQVIVAPAGVRIDREKVGGK